MTLSLLPHIEELARHRGSRVVVLKATNLDIDLLGVLYELLVDDGPSDKLDVVVHCRGGEVSAARRLALLLREFTGELSFIVPHFCESAGTIMALAADEIIASPAAVFSPIDPLLGSAEARSGEAPSVISAQDVRVFRQMAEAWFQLDGPEVGHVLFSTVCENIFPTTLTAFYRSLLEVRDVSRELLSLTGLPQARVEAIAEQLLFGFHSHSYAVTPADLRRIGLPVKEDRQVDAIAWRIARSLLSTVGGNARLSLDEDWLDAAIVTRERAAKRRRLAASGLMRWEFEETS